MTTCSTAWRMWRMRICLRRSFGPLRRGGSRWEAGCIEGRRLYGKGMGYLGGEREGMRGKCGIIVVDGCVDSTIY